MVETTNQKGMEPKYFLMTFGHAQTPQVWCNEHLTGCASVRASKDTSTSRGRFEGRQVPAGHWKQTSFEVFKIIGPVELGIFGKMELNSAFSIRFKLAARKNDKEKIDLYNIILSQCIL